MDIDERYDGEYEPMKHGNESFPVGVHKSFDPPNPAIKDNVKFQIIYPHWHSEFEFLYMSRGDCVVSIDGVEHNVCAGEAVLIPSNATHWAYRLISSRETEYYAVVFSHRLMSNGAPDVIYEKYIAPVINGKLILGPVFRRSEPWQAEVLDLLEEILSQYDSSPYDKDPYYPRHPDLFPRAEAKCPEFFTKTALFGIWYKCLLHATESKAMTRTGKLNYERVHRAINYMHEHFSERITLDDIVSSVFVSREHFSHMFKEYTNTSPFAYLNSYRIRKSMELLDRTDMKIIDVAVACGFEHVSYFNRKFIELVKCTPTEYRQRRK